jgi:Glyoxalase At5g48480-like, N-terminal domain
VTVRAYTRVECDCIGSEGGIMSVSSNPVPEGFHSLTPYMTINGASDAIEFYKQAFGAVETFR